MMEMRIDEDYYYTIIQDDNDEHVNQESPTLTHLGTSPSVGL